MANTKADKHGRWGTEAVGFRGCLLTSLWVFLDSIAQSLDHQIDYGMPRDWANRQTKCKNFILVYTL